MFLLMSLSIWASESYPPSSCRLSLKRSLFRSSLIKGRCRRGLSIGCLTIVSEAKSILFAASCERGWAWGPEGLTTRSLENFRLISERMLFILCIERRLCIDGLSKRIRLGAFDGEGRVGSSCSALLKIFCNSWRSSVRELAKRESAVSPSLGKSGSRAGVGASGMRALGRSGESGHPSCSAVQHSFAAMLAVSCLSPRRGVNGDGTSVYG